LIKRAGIGWRWISTVTGLFGSQGSRLRTLGEARGVGEDEEARGVGEDEDDEVGEDEEARGVGEDEACGVGEDEDDEVGEDEEARGVGEDEAGKSRQALGVVGSGEKAREAAAIEASLLAPTPTVEVEGEAPVDTFSRDSGSIEMGRVSFCCARFCVYNPASINAAVAPPPAINKFCFDAESSGRSITIT